MRKYFIILSILIFLIVAISILTMDVPTSKPVTFSTRGLNIKNKNTNLVVQLKSLDAKSKDTSINNTNIDKFRNLNTGLQVKDIALT